MGAPYQTRDPSSSVFSPWSLLGAYREEKDGSGARTGLSFLTLAAECVPGIDLESMDLDAVSGALCLRLSMDLSSVELPNFLFRTFSPLTLRASCHCEFCDFNYTPYKGIFLFA